MSDTSQSLDRSHSPALASVGVTWMIVEAELDAPAMQPLDELIGVRNERAPVITALPSVVVPGEIQHQRIERNAALAQPCDLLLEVALIVALELRPLGLHRAGKVFEIEIRDPRA